MLATVLVVIATVLLTDAEGAFCGLRFPCGHAYCDDPCKQECIGNKCVSCSVNFEKCRSLQFMADNCVQACYEYFQLKISQPDIFSTVDSVTPKPTTTVSPTGNKEEEASWWQEVLLFVGGMMTAALVCLVGLCILSQSVRDLIQDGVIDAPADQQPMMPPQGLGPVGYPVHATPDREDPQLAINGAVGDIPKHGPII